MNAAALWTQDALVAATGGTLCGSLPGPVTGVSIDTRTLRRGDLFVAVKGDNSDGHRHVAAALEAGAALCVVSRGYEVQDDAQPLLRVGDTLKALEDIGRAARARTGAGIVAVTGSVGKTGTKEALRLALAATGAVHVSLKSYNNHWGVPLSLARMPGAVDYAIFEVGMNHPGEITPLAAMIAPDIAIITTVEPVHLGHFSSVREIADAKAEIFTGLKPSGTAILNRDNSFFGHLRAAAREAGVERIVSFGSARRADARIIDMHLAGALSTVSAEIRGTPVAYRIGAPGAHLVMNSLAVLAAVDTLGADLALGALALRDWTPGPGRGARKTLRLAQGSAILIDESYNANPASMRAALRTLGTMTPDHQGRRIAVLGDMLELGPSGPRLHEELKQWVAEARVDLVFACGPLMRHLWDALPNRIQADYAQGSLELAAALRATLRAGDIVMIKGSLGSAMGLIVEALEAEFAKTGGK